MGRRNTIIVEGQHRNRHLAERSLAERIRKHKAKDGRIIARRSDNGKFSARGHHFLFELTLKPKKKYPPVLVSIRYERKKKNKSIIADLIIWGDLNWWKNPEAHVSEMAEFARKILRQKDREKEFLSNWFEGGFSTFSSGPKKDARQKRAIQIRRFARNV